MWADNWITHQSDPVFNANPVTRGRRAGLTPWQNGLAVATGGLSFEGSLAAENAKRQKYNDMRAGQQGLAAMQQQYGNRQALLDSYRSQEDTARNQALASLNQSYNNPQRQQSYADAYNARLNDSIAQQQQQYNQGLQSSSLALAARGRLGSSGDYENQARLQNALQLGVMGGQGDAAEYAQGLQSADYSQQDALRRSLLSGDPASAASFAGMANNATQQAQSLAGQASLADRQRLLNQLYGNAQSQQYGGYLNDGANYFNSRGGY